MHIESRPKYAAWSVTPSIVTLTLLTGTGPLFSCFAGLFESPNSTSRRMASEALAARFQRWSLSGSHSNRSLASSALGGCSFLRGGHAERHSAVQRIPRSHSSASLRSRSAMALSFSARASLRYRSARALLMASQIPTQQNKDFVCAKKGGPKRSVSTLRA